MGRADFPLKHTELIKAYFASLVSITDRAYRRLNGIHQFPRRPSA